MSGALARYARPSSDGRVQPRPSGSSVASLALLVCFAGCANGPAQESLPTGDWPVYGGDAYGTRFSPLRQINLANVGRVQVAWTYRTGEMSDPAFETRREPRLSTTPIVVDGVMFFGTPLGRIVALDPETGNELWTYDARSRRRIFIGTIDARLVVVDGRGRLEFPDGAP